MLLALTGSARPHEICYLDICYLIRHSSAYSFHFSKITKTARKNKIIHKINCNRINFTSSKNLCVYDHIHLYIKRTQNIRNRENQLLLGTTSPHNAVSIQTISRWLVHVLSVANKKCIHL